MKFHLNHTPKKADFEINHSHKLLLTGSCFAENIGGLLQEYKFESLTNPSGILFNPLSIYNTLNNCIDQLAFDSTNILENGNAFFSFLHHSSVNDSKKNILIEKINQINKSTFKFVKECNYLIITFGSAFYYRHVSLNTCVANCHKQPGSHFEKNILTVNEIVMDYGKLLTKLTDINPGLKIIFTVSPVKHYKDGIIENNISKATLLLSVDELTKKNKNVLYFPSYELVIDDLRDYRFYKEDMAHPNEQAIKYIWEKFSETYFSDKTKLLNDKLLKLNTALKHKPLHNNPEENLKFQKYIDGLNVEINKLRD